MSALKAIVMVVAISALYYGLMFFGAGFTGAGHGSDFFVVALFAPFSVSEVIAPAGIVLWPAVAVLLALRRFRACRVSAIVVLVLHYLGVVIVSYQTDWGYVRKVWHSLPVMVATFVVVYLATQVLMWTWIMRKQYAG